MTSDYKSDSQKSGADNKCQHIFKCLSISTFYVQFLWTVFLDHYSLI